MLVQSILFFCYTKEPFLIVNVTSFQMYACLIVPNIDRFLSVMHAAIDRCKNNLSFCVSSLIAGFTFSAPSLHAGANFTVSGGQFEAPYFNFADGAGQTSDFTTLPLYRGETYQFFIEYCILSGSLAD